MKDLVEAPEKCGRVISPLHEEAAKQNRIGRDKELPGVLGGEYSPEEGEQLSWVSSFQRTSTTGLGTSHNLGTSISHRTQVLAAFGAKGVWVYFKG